MEGVGAGVYRSRRRRLLAASLLDPEGTPAELALLSGVSHNEGSSGTTVYTFGVSRTVNTTGTTTVDWAVTGSGANPANAADFVGGVFPSGTLTFLDGEAMQNIAVNVNGDAAPEPQETFTVTLSNASGSAVITQATATGTIADDDTDPQWSNVVLLVGADGVDGSTAFVDESSKAKTVTAVGNAQIDTAQTAFGGGGSILLDGASDWLSIADDADFAFSNQPFTAECRYRWAGAVPTNNFRHLVGQCGEAGQFSWDLIVDCGAAGVCLTLVRSTSGSGVTSIAGPRAIQSAGQWYIAAIDFDGTTYRTYLGGVLQASSTSVITLFNSTAPFTIGARATADGVTQAAFGGWIDEVRITKGVARYASAAGYTVATAAFPRG